MNTPIALAGADGKRMTTLGIIAIVLGLLCMMAPVITGLSIALLLGILVMAAGVAPRDLGFQGRRRRTGNPEIRAGRADPDLSACCWW